MSEIKVLIVDDDPMVLDALATILAKGEDLRVVGRARSGEEAVSLARGLRPDVVCMDMRMGGIGGVTATAQLRAGLQPPQVLAITSFDEDQYLFGALEAGAAGFLLKERAHSDLVDSVRAVFAGHAMISARPTARLIQRHRATATAPELAEAADDFARLTAREQEIARLLHAGASNQDIADQLYLSHSTIKAAVATIMMKLDVDNRVQAAVVVERAIGAGRRQAPTTSA